MVHRPSLCLLSYHRREAVPPWLAKHMHWSGISQRSYCRRCIVPAEPRPGLSAIVHAEGVGRGGSETSMFAHGIPCEENEATARRDSQQRQPAGTARRDSHQRQPAETAPRDSQSRQPRGTASRDSQEGQRAEAARRDSQEGRPGGTARRDGQEGHPGETAGRDSQEGQPGGMARRDSQEGQP